MFGLNSLTETVYEEGVKNVALSALMGINGNIVLKQCVAMFISECLLKCFLFDLANLISIAATIFAYGQTSSGKTFTMRGITEKAVNDIYTHIANVSISSRVILLLFSKIT